jgi:hypothetical protein
VVNAENFGAPGVIDYRNPTIAGVLAQLGYAQRFGGRHPDRAGAHAGERQPSPGSAR